MACMGSMSQNRFCLLQVASAIVKLTKASKSKIVVRGGLQESLVLFLRRINLSTKGIGFREQKACRGVLGMRLKVTRKNSCRFCRFSTGERRSRLRKRRARLRFLRDIAMVLSAGPTQE